MEQLTLLLQVVIFMTQVILGVLLFRWERRQASTYECDELWLDITKALLSEPKLWQFYDAGPQEDRKSWQLLSDDDKRMYIFAEMNYFHFAFVYREFLKKRVSKAYWHIYKPWLAKLVRYSSSFRMVHSDSRDDFEPEFVALVDGLQVGSEGA